MRAMTSPRRTSAPSCETPRSARPCGPTSSSRGRAAAAPAPPPCPASRARAPAPRAARWWRARRSCARRAAAPARSGLLHRQLGVTERLAREQAVLEQLRFLSSRDCADCSSSDLTSIRPTRSTSDFSSVSRDCACWFSLILDPSRTCRARAPTHSRRVRRRDRLVSGGCRGAAGVGARGHRVGLDSTVSTSGVTVPDAMITIDRTCRHPGGADPRAADRRPIRPGNHTTRNARTRIGMTICRTPRRSRRRTFGR